MRSCEQEWEVCVVWVTVSAICRPLLAQEPGPANANAFKFSPKNLCLKA